jgi:hypothetical protein
MVFATNFLLQFTYLLRKEFDGAAAFGADHMVVAATIVLMLVAGNAIVERYDTREATLGEQLQGAVDRGVTDAGIFSLNEAVQFVGREVIACLEKGTKNGVALGGLLQADVPEVAMEDVLGLADHLAGEGGLIVDTFLQH